MQNKECQKSLLNCPFCGGEARLMYVNECGNEVCIDSEDELNASDIYPFVHCYDCDTEIFSNTSKTGKEVLEQWNTRKPMEKINEEIMDLYTYYDNDYFSSKGNTLVDRNEVIEIVEKGGME